MRNRLLLFFVISAASAAVFAGCRKSPSTPDSEVPMFDTIVRRFLYYPTRLPRDAGPPSYARGAREVFFRAGDGNEIHALYWPAPEGRPTILFFHGNAQTVFEWALIHEELAPLECGLFLVDYPGYGKSTGEPSEASLYAAGQAALKHLTDGEKIDEARIVIFGKSLGGGVTAEVAKGRRVMGIVLESTFTSIPSVARLLLPMIPSDALLASERYESLKKLSEITVPVLVVHGDRDELIPVDEGKKLYDAAREPKKLYIVPGAGHNDVSMTAGPAYGRALRAWLDGIEPSR